MMFRPLTLILCTSWLAFGFKLNGNFSGGSIDYTCSSDYWQDSITCCHVFPYEDGTPECFKATCNYEDVCTYEFYRGTKVWFSDSLAVGQNKTTCTNWKINDRIEACLYTTLDSDEICFQVTLSNMFMDITSVNLGCFSGDGEALGETVCTGVDGCKNKATQRLAGDAYREGAKTVFWASQQIGSRSEDVSEDGELGGYFNHCSWIQTGSQMICTKDGSQTLYEGLMMSYEKPNGLTYSLLLKGSPLFSGSLSSQKTQVGSCQSWPGDDTVKTCLGARLMSQKTAQNFYVCYTTYEKYMFMEVHTQQINCYNVTFRA